MAHLLKALGEAALRPQKVRGLWYKPVISGRRAGELRRAALLEGQEWPYDKERSKPKKHGLVKKLKGHKHEIESRIRQQDIERKMADMPKMIADFRKTSKPKEPSLLDSILTTAKERKLKARGP
ncbi:hypothetical protein WJX84_002677 [Apatococcus fuscideae]|uniref:Large ribosomal subunit protein mL59 domain-containing protein n=1 Tax=Apatococcus fuscideae TaxID=2026836 RepID=A0AAW1SNN4_9CHLO